MTQEKVVLDRQRYDGMQPSFRSYLQIEAPFRLFFFFLLVVLFSTLLIFNHSGAQILIFPFLTLLLYFVLWRQK